MFVLIKIITLGVRRLKIYLSSLLNEHEGSWAETISQFPTMKEVERKNLTLTHSTPAVLHGGNVYTWRGSLDKTCAMRTSRTYRDCRERSSWALATVSVHCCSLHAGERTSSAKKRSFCRKFCTCFSLSFMVFFFTCDLRVVACWPMFSCSKGGIQDSSE